MRDEKTETTSRGRLAPRGAMPQPSLTMSIGLTLLWAIGCAGEIECVPFELSDEHHAMCHAAVVFIGRVSSLDVDENSDPHGLNTTGFFIVESAIHGNVDRVEQVWVRGGRVGTYEEYVSGYPFLEIGDRYLFALASPRADGPGAIVGWTDLPENACQTEQPALRDEFNVICER